MLIQRETQGQADAIRAVIAAAFGRLPPPGKAPPEAGLVDELRANDAWLPKLSLVAISPAGDLIGHVLCTRAKVGAAPALGLGPLSVRPEHQRRGVGRALMHAVLGAADALDEPLVALLDDPRYYRQFGFRLAAEYGITPPVPDWHPAFPGPPPHRVRAHSARPVRLPTAIQPGMKAAVRPGRLRLRPDPRGPPATASLRV